MSKGPFILERAGLLQLLQALKALGYLTLGPTVREGAIVYDELRQLEDLPIGYTDRQEGGSYRLERRGDGALFGYNVGPHSWKRFLHPPILRLFRARQGNGGLEFESESEAAPKYAFIGVRACELQAIRVQDRVFLGGPYQDPHYKARREQVFIVAVNCTQAGHTCFCASVESGPRAQTGFDLALTEVVDGEHSYFVGEVGSEAGARLLDQVAHRAAQEAEWNQALALVDRAARQMRHLDTQGLKERLYQSLEHPRWQVVANRCLSCGNCTQVCPTCFCTSVEDHTDLSGQVAERTRRWDSCFTADFSYLHGGSVRVSTLARYRQWLTHKLASWQDQFGLLGCVGCGRCITWCPVGIDLTEEVAAMNDVQTGRFAPKEAGGAHV